MVKIAKISIVESEGKRENSKTEKSDEGDSWGGIILILSSISYVDKTNPSTLLDNLFPFCHIVNLSNNNNNFLKPWIKIVNFLNKKTK